MSTYYNRNTELIDSAKNIVQVSPGGELKSAELVRIAGSTFSGTTVDPNFWTTSATGSATTTQTNSNLILSTGITANSTVTTTGTEIARYVGEAANQYSGVISLGDSGTVNNVRQWGVFNATDGMFFQLSGAVLSICTMAGGVITSVQQANWNGVPVVVKLTNANVYRIVYNTFRVSFYINNTVVHTVSGSASQFTNNYNLPIATSNVNSNGLATNLTITARSIVVQRIGQQETQPKYVYITTATTTVAKYGPGTLHKITINTGAAGTATIYDNTALGGTIIALVTDTATNGPNTLWYDVAFNNGLTIVSTGTCNMTVTYE